MNNKGHDYALISLMLGIGSVCLVLLKNLAIIGIVCGITAIIFSKKSREENLDNEGMAKAGLILGIIGIVIDTIRIILSIIIIILGLSLFNGIFDYSSDSSSAEFENITKNIWDSVKDDTADTFNKTFEIYEGTKSGEDVIALLSAVITNNNMNSNIVTIEYGDEEVSNSNDISRIINDINESSYYEVSLDYNNNGYVDEIEIELSTKGA